MDGCCLGVDIPMCCVLLLLRPSSHPVQSKRFVEEERVGFIGDLGFVCSGISGVEHMGMIMGHGKVLNFHSSLCHLSIFLSESLECKIWLLSFSVDLS
jgi:hypothetical protein